jgi:hypothetical protein
MVGGVEADRVEGSMMATSEEGGAVRRMGGGGQGRGAGAGDGGGEDTLAG